MPDLEHDSAPDGWLIYKAGRGWYRPQAQGYTNDPKQAGRYTREEADAYSHPNGWNGPRDEISIHHESEVLRQSPEPSSSEVRVKGLHWEAPDQSAWLGSGIEPCEYYIRRDGELWVMPGEYQADDAVEYATIEEAKAAAQADYEQRIRSALEPTLSQPGTGEEVEVFWFNPWNDYHGFQQVADEYAGTEGTVPLVRLSDYQALKAERDEARAEIERMTPKFVAYEYLESPARADAAEARLSAAAAALTSIAEMSVWQVGVPIDTEAANEHARIASAMSDIAREALSKAKEADGDQPS